MITLATWAHLMAEAAEFKGEHFWSLVGRLAVTLGIPIGTVLGGTIFWLGQLSSRVDTQERQTTHLIEVIGGLVTFSSQSTERAATNSAEIQRLRDKVDSMIIHR